MLVLSFVHMSEHYCLLSLAFKNKDITHVRYFDTLTVESLSCRKFATWVGQLFNPTFELPERTNSLRQQVGSVSCGQWCLAYVEIEAAEWCGCGPAACGHPNLVRLNWELRLQTLSAQLKNEETYRRQCLEKEQIAHQKQAAVAAKELRKKAEQAKRAQELGEAISIELALADEYVNKNKKLTILDLSQDIRNKIERIALLGVKICVSCRYSSGCLRCDVDKATRYHLRKESERRGFEQRK
jgi:hypothetical protein